MSKVMCHVTSIQENCYSFDQHFFPHNMIFESHFLGFPVRTDNLESLKQLLFEAMVTASNPSEHY